MATSRTLPLSAEDVNGLDYHEFMNYFGNVVESCRLCTATIWAEKPFKNAQAVHEATCRFLDRLSIQEKEGILRLYPDLAGKDAHEGTLTSDSVIEHKTAGLYDLSEDSRTKLQQMNILFRQKFDFPFIICAKKSNTDIILKEISRRYLNSKDQEIINGIEQVKKISHLRILALVKHDVTSNL